MKLMFLAFELVCELMKDNEDTKNLDMEKMLFSMFKQMAVGVKSNLEVCVVFTNQKVNQI